MIYKCPKCGNKKLEKTRKGYNVRCSNHWCDYLSEKMTKEEVLKIINFVPSAMDIALDEIDENSEYFEEGEENLYISVEKVKEIIEKYFTKLEKKEE